MILISSLATAASSFGRLGESQGQCNDRYGTPTFHHASADLECRYYDFNRMKIQVIFYDNKSVMEIISSQPRRVFNPEAVQPFLSESTHFFRGLLSSAYHFTEDQLKPLNRVDRTSRLELTSGFVTNGDLGATLSFRTNEAEDSIKFRAMLITSGQERKIMDRVVEFQGQTMVLEAQSQERDRAAGF
jgi:hypothetical protein